MDAKAAAAAATAAAWAAGDRHLPRDGPATTIGDDMSDSLCAAVARDAQPQKSTEHAPRGGSMMGWGELAHHGTEQTQQLSGYTYSDLARYIYIYIVKQVLDGMGDRRMTDDG